MQHVDIIFEMKIFAYSLNFVKKNTYLDII